MKEGDEQLINMQSETVINIRGQIVEMQKSRAQLTRFATKIRVASLQTTVGDSMVAVSKALGRVSNNIQLEKVSDCDSFLTNNDAKICSFRWRK